MCSIISSSPIKHGVEFLFQVDAENYFKNKHKKVLCCSLVQYELGSNTKQAHRATEYWNLPSAFLMSISVFRGPLRLLLTTDTRIEMRTVMLLDSISFWLARQPHHPDLCVSACAQECIHLCVCVFACVPCREACELWIMCFTVWCPLDICL